MILQSPILSGSVQISGSIVLNDGPISATANIVSSSTVVDTFTSSTTKVVNHGFDTKNVFVQVYNNSDDLINPGSITTTDTNNVTITFPTPVSGRVIVGKSGHLVSGSAIAESVEFDNILNKPALVSGSSIASASLATTAERVQAGSSGSRDLTTPQSGSLWYNTDTSILEVYSGVSGSEWRSVTYVEPSPYGVDFLIVAGGGGGGGSTAGGGGAGGLRTSHGSNSGGGTSSETTPILTPGTQYTIIVGAGGTGGRTANSGTPDGTSGETSSISGNGLTTITSTGGGYGASGRGDGVTGSRVAANGGSGGGGGWYNGNDLDITAAGSGTSGQGYRGGNSSTNNDYGGAGGGGASAAAADVDNGGNGGAGLAVSITGTSVTYAGGGGGGGHDTAGAGGAGGGGAGNVSSNATAGTANTGGGGGGVGVYQTGNGGAGGSGVVILRMLTSDYSDTTTGSPTVTGDGTYTILTYTQSGTYTA